MAQRQGRRDNSYYDREDSVDEESLSDEQSVIGEELSIRVESPTDPVKMPLTLVFGARNPQTTETRNITKIHNYTSRSSRNYMDDQRRLRQRADQPGVNDDESIYEEEQINPPPSPASPANNRSQRPLYDSDSPQVGFTVLPFPQNINYNPYAGQADCNMQTPCHQAGEKGRPSWGVGTNLNGPSWGVGTTLRDGASQTESTRPGMQFTVQPVGYSPGGGAHSPRYGSPGRDKRESASFPVAESSRRRPRSPSPVKRRNDFAHGGGEPPGHCGSSGMKNRSASPPHPQNCNCAPQTPQGNVLSCLGSSCVYGVSQQQEQQQQPCYTPRTPCGANDVPRERKDSSSQTSEDDDSDESVTVTTTFVSNVQEEGAQLSLQYVSHEPLGRQSTAPSSCCAAGAGMSSKEEQARMVVQTNAGNAPIGIQLVSHEKPSPSTSSSRDRRKMSSSASYEASQNANIKVEVLSNEMHPMARQGEQHRSHAQAMEAQSPAVQLRLQANEDPSGAPYELQLVSHTMRSPSPSGDTRQGYGHPQGREFPTNQAAAQAQEAQSPTLQVQLNEAGHQSALNLQLVSHDAMLRPGAGNESTPTCGGGMDAMAGRPAISPCHGATRTGEWTGQSSNNQTPTLKLRLPANGDSSNAPYEVQLLSHAPSSRNGGQPYGQVQARDAHYNAYQDRAGQQSHEGHSPTVQLQLAEPGQPNALNVQLVSQDIQSSGRQGTGDQPPTFTCCQNTGEKSQDGQSPGVQLQLLQPGQSSALNLQLVSHEMHAMGENGVGESPRACCQRVGEKSHELSPALDLKLAEPGQKNALNLQLVSHEMHTMGRKGFGDESPCTRGQKAGGKTHEQSPALGVNVSELGHRNALDLQLVSHETQPSGRQGTGDQSQSCCQKTGEKSHEGQSPSVQVQLNESGQPNALNLQLVSHEMQLTGRQAESSHGCCQMDAMEDNRAMSPTARSTARDRKQPRDQSPSVQIRMQANDDPSDAPYEVQLVSNVMRPGSPAKEGRQPYGQPPCHTSTEERGNLQSNEAHSPTLQLQLSEGQRNAPVNLQLVSHPMGPNAIMAESRSCPTPMQSHAGMSNASRGQRMDYNMMNANDPESSQPAAAKVVVQANDEDVPVTVQLVSNRMRSNQTLQSCCGQAPRESAGSNRPGDRNKCGESPMQSRMNPNQGYQNKQSGRPKSAGETCLCGSAQPQKCGNHIPTCPLSKRPCGCDEHMRSMSPKSRNLHNVSYETPQSGYEPSSSYQPRAGGGYGQPASDAGSPTLQVKLNAEQDDPNIQLKYVSNTTRPGSPQGPSGGQHRGQYASNEMQQSSVPPCHARLPRDQQDSRMPSVEAELKRNEQNQHNLRLVGNEMQPMSHQMQQHTNSQYPYGRQMPYQGLQDARTPEVEVQLQCNEQFPPMKVQLVSNEMQSMGHQMQPQGDPRYTQGRQMQYQNQQPHGPTTPGVEVQLQGNEDSPQLKVQVSSEMQPQGDPRYAYGRQMPYQRQDARTPAVELQLKGSEQNPQLHVQLVSNEMQPQEESKNPYGGPSQQQQMQPQSKQHESPAPGVEIDIKGSDQNQLKVHFVNNEVQPQDESRYPQGRQSHPQQSHPHSPHTQQSYPQQSHPHQAQPTHSQQGHHQQGHPQQSHPQQGHPQQGHPQQGHQQQGHYQQEHPQQGHPQHGHHQQAHPQQGHQHQGHPQQAHPQHGHHQQGHNQQAHPTQGHQHQGHPQQANHQQAHHQQAHPQQANHQQAHHQQAHPQQAHPQQAHPQQAHPQQAHHQQAHPQQAHPQQAHHQQAHPQQAHPQQVHPQQGHPQQGYHNQGHPQQGYHNQGHPQQEHAQQMNHQNQAPHDARIPSVALEVKGSDRDPGVKVQFVSNEMQPSSPGNNLMYPYGRQMHPQQGQQPNQQPPDLKPPAVEVELKGTERNPPIKLQFVSNEMQPMFPGDNAGNDPYSFGQPQNQPYTYGRQVPPRAPNEVFQYGQNGPGGYPQEDYAHPQQDIRSIMPKLQQISDQQNYENKPNTPLQLQFVNDEMQRIGPQIVIETEEPGGNNDQFSQPDESPERPKSPTKRTPRSTTVTVTSMPPRGRSPSKAGSRSPPRGSRQGSPVGNIMEDIFRKATTAAAGRRNFSTDQPHQGYAAPPPERGRRGSTDSADDNSAALLAAADCELSKVENLRAAGNLQGERAVDSYARAARALRGAALNAFAAKETLRKQLTAGGPNAGAEPPPDDSPSFTEREQTDSEVDSVAEEGEAPVLRVRVTLRGPEDDAQEVTAGPN